MEDGGLDLSDIEGLNPQQIEIILEKAKAKPKRIAKLQ